ncbi:MAG: T9SS type A sorting domain-containing protein [Flavobacteriales bacterium]|nr:T9SS type A sorting domain-containing protein [Flavobacteriales bacterium]HRN36226.1 T9SS type A sorting domain-containing protein [Flavobacteriales bacterium]HRO41047.1 T9SS type A sorting domain-containing protein [Flavobacteriales bacterium]
MKVLTLALLAAMTASSGGAQVPLTLDTSFRCTRFLNNGLIALLPLEDGSVLASGWYVRIDGSNIPYSFFRILPNGDLDESWTSNWGYGDILTSGDYYYLTINGFPARYFRTTGTLDQGFLPITENYPHPGLVTYNGGDVYVQPDGMVLCTGDHRVAEQWGINAPGWYSLLRVDTNGILDSTYQWRKTDGVIWTLVPTTQGRLLVSGVYNTYEGQPEGRILRIWPDGSLDTTFHTNIIKGYATCLVEQPNGRILAGGQFVFPNEPDTLHLIRLMPDGALDTTFNNHTQYSHVPPLSFGDFAFSVNALLPLGDGRIMVGGDFTHIAGQLRRGIALLDSTGHLLTTAFTGQGCGLWHDFNSTYLYSGLTDIKQAPDGSIFVCGFFKGFDDGTVSDTSMTFIAKLHGLSVGIHEAERPVRQVQLWPNPGTDVLHIETGTTGHMDVQVRDAMGRAVLAASGTGVLKLSSAALSPGVYLIEVDSGGERRTVKWMKQ